MSENEIRERLIGFVRMGISRPLDIQAKFREEGKYLPSADVRIRLMGLEREKVVNRFRVGQSTHYCLREAPKPLPVKRSADTLVESLIHDALYDVIFASVEDLNGIIRRSDGSRVGIRGIRKAIVGMEAKGEIECVRIHIHDGQGHPMTYYRHAKMRKAA